MFTYINCKFIALVENLVKPLPKFQKEYHGTVCFLIFSYLLFPFVYELRTVTDWMWTETTLTLTEWVGMEDIFCTVFQLKVSENLLGDFFLVFSKKLYF